MADPIPDSSASGEARPAKRVVLMADRTEGAEELAHALRHDGLSVLTCDVIAIPERASRVRPLGVVVDLEQPNAAPAVTRLLVSTEHPFALAAIGTVEVARRLNLAADERARLFRRPVVPSEIIAFIHEMAAATGSLPPPAASSSAGSGPGSGTGSGTGVGTGVSDDGLLSDFPAMAGMPEVEGILPKLDGGPISTKIAGQLSPEIEALLESSAKRVREQDQERGQPMAEANVLVPPEMLALVDDLLAGDEPPATRGGVDLAAMLADPPPPGSSSQSAAFDSQPSWHTGVPDAAISDLGSVPTGLVSDYGDSSPGEERDRGTDAPGTSIGLGEETSVPGGGTQVGHSSPLEGSAPPPLHPSDPPSGSSPPMPTELRSHSAPGSQLPPMPQGLRSDMPLSHTLPDSYGSAPPGRSDSDKPTGLHQSAVADASPDSVMLAASEVAPRTTAGMPTFSSRHPRRDSAPPLTQLGMPATQTRPVDSREVVRGDPSAMLAGAVRRRVTGALVLSSQEGTVVRRVLLRDGDMVNAASEHEGDALVDFLVERGDLSPEVATLRSARLPQTGRHAAAALIANGFLGQDDLWPVLRSHAEWIIGRALVDAPALGQLEREPPERLRAEPNVFGGAAGVEVYIDAVRRVVPADVALARLGGPETVLTEGPSIALMAESALSSEDIDRLRAGLGQTIGSVVDPYSGFESVIYALVSLGILTARAPSRRPVPEDPPEIDPLDADAVRQRVLARMALVHEADYFSLLGVTANATAYEIRRAYVDLRRTFEPNRLLTAATADLHDDVNVIVEVLDEAYQILRDPHRRTRYRRALEAAGPRP